MQYITITSRTPSNQPYIITIRNQPDMVAKNIAILKNKKHTDITVENYTIN